MEMEGKNSNVTEKFFDYILSHHKQEVIEILKNPDESRCFFIIINFITLFEENIELGNGLLAEPEKFLFVFDNTVVSAQTSLLEQMKRENLDDLLTVKSKVFIRITALPVFGETLFPSNDDLGSFIKINGTLIKVGPPKLLEYRRDYLCGKCQHVTQINAKYDRYYIITPPNKCEKCSSSKIEAKKDTSTSYFKDYQEVKVQEHFGKSEVGTVPHTIWITLEDDLVDTCKPGDDVVVTGIVKRRWKALRPNVKYDIELVLKANNIELCNEQKSGVTNEEVNQAFCKFWDHYKNQELFARNQILKSFCPQIYGLYLVKLAMATVLAGGVQKIDENGCSTRGTSHLLLVGDAGTGKSHLLRYASKLASRSVFTTGVGSTSAGLTVSAIRESGDWNLEAGALVLADGGVCCIDDFNSIREHDRTSIHEAMEQQSISVAKAGIVTKLNTRCSIFATTSCKGKYDCSVPMSVNVAISSPLLSRFDIVLILLDSKNPDWDELLCSFIFKGGKSSELSQDSFPFSSRADLCVTDIWSTATLQSYFSTVKLIEPVLTVEAGIILRAYYQAQRMANSRSAARTTVRLLESLIRLSQGHARLMFRREVKVLDAVVAISLIESSLQSDSGTPSLNSLHTKFPEDPYNEYKSQLEIILTKLQLNDILRKELEDIKKIEHMFCSEISKSESSSALKLDGEVEEKNFPGGKKENGKNEGFKVLRDNSFTQMASSDSKVCLNSLEKLSATPEKRWPSTFPSSKSDPLNEENQMSKTNGNQSNKRLRLMDEDKNTTFSNFTQDELRSKTQKKLSRFKNSTQLSENSSFSIKNGKFSDLFQSDKSNSFMSQSPPEKIVTRPQNIFGAEEDWNDLDL